MAIATLILLYPGHISEAERPKPKHIDTPNQCVLTSSPFFGPVEPPHFHIAMAATAQPVQEPVGTTSTEAIIERAKNMAGKHGGQCVEFV